MPPRSIPISPPGPPRCAGGSAPPRWRCCWAAWPPSAAAACRSRWNGPRRGRWPWPTTCRWRAWCDASTPPTRRHLSGFRLLADGADALATRLALIRGARRSLDLQYFLIAADASGEQLLDELHAAAERGVRVRLLLDDLHAVAHDARLAALDRHAHARCGCSTRCRCATHRWRGGCWGRCTISTASTGACTTSCSSPTATSRWPAAATSATTTSCAAAVANFVDLDILATGPVVAELVDLFDRFWNDELAYPVRSLVRATRRRAFVMPALRRRLPAPPDADSVAAQILPRPAGAAVRQRAAVRRCAEQGLARRCAPAARRGHGAGAGADAGCGHSDVMIASPYFVPGAGGLALMQEASASAASTSR